MDQDAQAPAGTDRQGRLNAQFSAQDGVPCPARAVLDCVAQGARNLVIIIIRELSPNAD